MNCQNIAQNYAKFQGAEYDYSNNTILYGVSNKLGDFGASVGYGNGVNPIMYKQNCGYGVAGANPCLYKNNDNNGYFDIPTVEKFEDIDVANPTNDNKLNISVYVNSILIILIVILLVFSFL